MGAPCVTPDWLLLKHAADCVNDTIIISISDLNSAECAGQRASLAGPLHRVGQTLSVHPGRAGMGRLQAQQQKQHYLMITTQTLQEQENSCNGSYQCS